MAEDAKDVATSVQGFMENGEALTVAREVDVSEFHSCVTVDLILRHCAWRSGMAAYPGNKDHTSQ